MVPLGNLGQLFQSHSGTFLAEMRPELSPLLCRLQFFPVPPPHDFARLLVEDLALLSSLCFFRKVTPVGTF
jgi:hypothetical protein